MRTRFPETDIVIVRENHEDLYAGIEFEQGSRGGRRSCAQVLKELSGKEIRAGLRHLDQADLDLRHDADRARGVRVRARATAAAR